MESLLTQTLIIHVIRTDRIPLIQSRASWPLMAMTAVIVAVGVVRALQFVHLIECRDGCLGVVSPR